MKLAFAVIGLAVLGAANAKQRRFNRVFDSAMCAGDGDLWLHLAGGGPSWVILDASNTFKGTVDFPPNSQLGYATRDRDG